MTPFGRMLDRFMPVALIVILAVAAAVLAPGALSQVSIVQDGHRSAAANSPSDAVDPGHPRPRNESARAGMPALILARVCKLEAEARLADCRAIYWIGRKTAGDDWPEFLLRYSRLYQRRNARARRIASAPWGDIPGASRRENREWSRLRAYAAELADGKHVDNCPPARHWGGTMDRPRGGQVRAACAAGTANTLYAVGR